MSFIITGLNGNSFQHLYGLSDDELKAYGAIRFNVDKYPSCPDRITLTDIPMGKRAILLNHTYLDSRSPYRGTQAIFIWEGKIEPKVLKDEIPEIMQNRMISLRAFDQNDMMIEPPRESWRLNSCQQQSNFDPPLFNNSSCNLTHLITQD